MSGRRAKQLRKLARKLYDGGNLDEVIAFKSFYMKIKRQYVRRNNG